MPPVATDNQRGKQILLTSQLISVSVTTNPIFYQNGKEQTSNPKARLYENNVQDKERTFSQKCLHLI